MCVYIYIYIYIYILCTKGRPVSRPGDCCKREFSPREMGVRELLSGNSKHPCEDPNHKPEIAIALTDFEAGSTASSDTA